MITVNAFKKAIPSLPKQSSKVKLRWFDKRVSLLNRLKHKQGLSKIELEHLNYQQKYFQFSGKFLGEHVQIYWPVNHFLNQYFPQDQLDLSLIDNELAIQLANDYLEINKNLCNFDDIELISTQNIIFGKEYRKLLYRYANASATIWLETFDDLSNFKNQDDYLNIKFNLAFLLGSTALSIKQLKRLSVGDVVRIDNWQNTIYSASQPVFRFNFSATSITIQEIIEMDEQLQEIDDAKAPSAQVVDKAVNIKNLPIQCQFYLPNQEFEYDQLSSLAIGDVLPLSHNAVSHIQMQIGTQSIAEGELVQMGDEVGFEIQKIYINK